MTNDPGALLAASSREMSVNAAQHKRLFGLFFFLSGAAALIYQSVWQRLLSLHYGVGAVSSVIIVSIFMLGLGAGSLIGGWLAERVGPHVWLYMAVESGVGAFGLASLQFLERLAAHTAGSSYLVSSFCVLAFLLVPTLLMGTTLPIAVKVLSASPASLLENLSSFYFLNTVGAAVGALGASYGVVSLWGLDCAVYVAVTINIGLGVLILVYRPQSGGPASSTTVERSPVTPVGRWMYASALVTGFLAIGYQIVWFRIIGTILKDSPYSFSTILGVYLLALAFGSRRIRRRARRSRWADLYFGANAGIALYSLASITVFGALSRLWPLSGVLRSIAAVGATFPLCHAGRSACAASIVVMIFWPAVFMWIPVTFMGMSFPLATYLLQGDSRQPARAAGSMYAVSIVGNVLGGIATGFVLIPALGSERVLLTFGLVGLLFMLFVRQVGTRALALRTRALCVAVVATSAVVVFPGRASLFEAIDGPPSTTARSFFAEGVDAAVLTYADGPVVKNYINGNVHGGRPFPLFVEEGLQAMSHTGSPGRALVIGYGTGTLTEVALVDDRVKSLTLVELSPTLLSNVRKLPQLDRSLSDPRVTIVVEDARRYLLRSRERYDVIMMDPVRSGASYSNNLYSIEFFELLRSHLTVEGTLLVWLDDYGVLPRTIATVFPESTVFDCGFMLASGGPQRWDSDRYRQLRSRVVQPTFDRPCAPAADRLMILARSEGLPINRSARPVTEYFLGAQLKGYKERSVLDR